MRPAPMLRRLALALATSIVASSVMATSALAQRHSGGSSPPTAPHAAQHPAPPAIIEPVSSGLGALQFMPVSYGVPAPQSLTRQLQADDDRTRTASLSAIGAPAQYLVHGHVPYPHSVQLDFVDLGSTDELDAILTVELDQHIVSAILVPEDGNWHRIATVLYQTAFADPSTSPSTFLRIDRSLLQKEHYRAVFHAITSGTNGDYTENEAHLRILNGHAIVTLSFASNARSCDTTHKFGGCELTHRWLQPDTSDPAHRFLMVTGTGRLTSRESNDPLAGSLTFQLAHLRTFTCQPFIFSDSALRYQPTANPAPCATPR
jgi:hypothetical protein